MLVDDLPGFIFLNRAADIPIVKGIAATVNVMGLIYNLLEAGGAGATHSLHPSLSLSLPLSLD